MPVWQWSRNECTSLSLGESSCVREKQREKEGRGSSTMKGVRGSGGRDARRWVAIEIERAQAVGRGMVEVQQQYGVQGREKVLERRTAE